jgi:hypothetical protein
VSVDSTKRIMEELVEFFLPLLSALESPASFGALLRALGRDAAAEDLEALFGGLVSSRQELAAVVDRVEEKADFGQALDEENYAQIASTSAHVFAVLRELPSRFPDFGLGPDFLSELFDLLVARYLHFRAPPAFRGLIVLGVLESDFLAPGRDDEARDVAFEKFTFSWQRLRLGWSSPADLMREVYGWGTEDFAADGLLTNLALFVDELGVVVLPQELPDPVVDTFTDWDGGTPRPFGFELPLYQDFEAEDETEVGLLSLPIKGKQAPTAEDRGVGLMPYVVGSVAARTPVSDDGTWTFNLAAGAGLAGGIVFSLHPSGLHVDTGVLDNTVPAGSFRMELEKAPAPGQSAILLLGDPDGTRLEAQGFTFGIGGEDGDFYVAAGVKDLRLVIDVSGDALLSQIVREPVMADAGDLVGGWRLERGIYFEQGSGLSLRLPVDRRVGGVVALRQLGLSLEFEPGMALATTLSGELSIGPLFLSVEELGFRIAIVPNSNGTFGIFDLDVGVRFPTGYAAHLEAGPISGGGQLAKRDHEYRGALSLRFESFGLSAYAVLTTRMPSGEPGFSFLASIFGDLEVQLGYGFKLTGVGGIIGIDRGANVEQLQAVLADGRLDSVLFPRAAIRDAAVILDDMAAIFPPRRGQYLVGPMARLAWGTPTLIEGKLGVVLEVGAETRAVVVGSLETVLPVKSAAVVVLRVDFIGAVEFATGAIGFDGRLTNSRILSWPVSGEAAVRTGWGSSAGLVASVGGFHPAFAPPPGFPNGLQPMTVDFATNNPSLTLTAYLAVTLNSVQAGANASLYGKGPKIPFVGRFAVEGSVGFDALIYFDPFAFDTKLWLGLDLLLDGNVVCGIGGDLRLRGPNRYEISGKVSASVLGVTVKVKVNKTWGTPVTETPQTVDGAEVLRAAVRTAEGFEPIAVTTRVSGVGFARQTRGEARALIDPSGGVRFVQRALPLAVAIDRIGTSRLVGDANIFDLAFADNGSTISGNAATSEFVRGAFFDLDESERLRGPATERHKNGIQLRGPDDVDLDENAAHSFDFEYETIFLGDDAEDTRPLQSHPVDAQVTDRLIRLTAERTSTPLNSNYVPAALRQRIGVTPVSYVVVGGSAVDSGPRPSVAADGSLITGALSSVVGQRGRDERAIARYLAAPAG